MFLHRLSCNDPLHRNLDFARERGDERRVLLAGNSFLGGLGVHGMLLNVLSFTRSSQLAQRRRREETAGPPRSFAFHRSLNPLRARD